MKDTSNKGTTTKLVEYASKLINLNMYWRRKSKKLVIAIVCLNKPNTSEKTSEYIWVAGINVEVSIAAGSLCAERNAISSAVTQYPQLQKQDFVEIAVAEFNTKTLELQPIQPCCLCGDWLRKLWGETWQDNVFTV